MPDKPPYSKLSPREKDVFRLVLRGKTKEQIAKELGLSLQRIKDCFFNGCHKMGAPDNPKLAARRAKRSGQI